MTSENLVRLFEKGLSGGKNFRANTNSSNRSMDFSYSLEDNDNNIYKYNPLGSITIICEFDDSDYYSNKLDNPHFGVSYYIKYDIGISEFKAFKFSIDSETFSRLLKLYRVFERTQAQVKEVEKMMDFRQRLQKLETQYDIEVNPIQRTIITEKQKP